MTALEFCLRCENILASFPCKITVDFHVVIVAKHLDKLWLDDDLIPLGIRPPSCLRTSPEHPPESALISCRQYLIIEPQTKTTDQEFGSSARMSLGNKRQFAVLPGPLPTGTGREARGSAEFGSESESVLCAIVVFDRSEYP